MADTSQKSLLRDLLVAIIPLFFGAFIFAGMLETYKNGMLSQKDLVVDVYRPMREALIDCRTTQNQLFLSQHELANTFRLMLNECDHMTTVDPRLLTRDYVQLPQSIYEANQKVSTRTNELGSAFNACSSALFRRYEEVALATGTYDKFLEIQKTRTAALTALYTNRNGIANDLAEKVNADSMMNTLRNSLSSEMNTAEEKAAFSKKIHEFAGPAIELWTMLAKSQEDEFKIDQKTDEQLVSMFAKEVSRRYKRGLFSALWPG